MPKSFAKTDLQAVAPSCDVTASFVQLRCFNRTEHQATESELAETVFILVFSHGDSQVHRGRPSQPIDLESHQKCIMKSPRKLSFYRFEHIHRKFLLRDHKNRFRCDKG